MEKHELHLAVAEAIAERLRLVPGATLLRDPACGKGGLLQLFAGTSPSRENRMCCVDLLVLSGEQVRVIVEIEESGFLPTKICGKFLQAGIATHFIPAPKPKRPIAYSPDVMFVQVLGGERWADLGPDKRSQADLISEGIRRVLPATNISRYELKVVGKENIKSALVGIGELVADAVRPAHP